MIQEKNSRKRGNMKKVYALTPRAIYFFAQPAVSPMIVRQFSTPTVCEDFGQETVAGDLQFNQISEG